MTPNCFNHKQQKIDLKKDYKQEPMSIEVTIDNYQIDPKALKLNHLKRPLNLIVIGMAGSGKSTFLGKFHSYLMEHYDALPYMVNLDPAVSFLPFSPANDIRDEIKYKEVMKKYNLGPNGAIMTSLNLYASKFHLTLQKIEENQKYHK